jgi:hypothetical protein
MPLHGRNAGSRSDWEHLDTTLFITEISLAAGRVVHLGGRRIGKGVVGERRKGASINRIDRMEGRMMSVS